MRLYLFTQRLPIRPAFQDLYQVKISYIFSFLCLCGV
jgi:hypothetical protein